MSKYIPKFDKEDKELLILDDLFTSDECLDYADKHNMDVLFTETTSTSSVRIIMDFQKRGFKHELYEEKVFAPGGLELDPKVVCRFTR